MRATLPQPVLDLEQAKADLDRYGYCLVAGALSAERVSALKARLAELAATEVEAGVDYLYSGGSNQRVWSLLNKDTLFVDLAENEVALALAEHVLGENPLLSNLSANIAGPGGEPMAMHWDQDYVPRPWPHALMAHVIWMLDAFTPQNGATLVVPGSHGFESAPRGATPIPAVGPPGTAFCLDARTWHGTGANRTTERRHAILAYYCRLFVRQQENYSLSLDRKVLEKMSPGLRKLLGFSPVDYVGMVDGPPRDWPRY